jgi:hypothetical protein
VSIEAADLKILLELMNHDRGRVLRAAPLVAAVYQLLMFR